MATVSESDTLFKRLLFDRYRELLTREEATFQDAKNPQDDHERGRFYYRAGRYDMAKRFEEFIEKTDREAEQTAAELRGRFEGVRLFEEVRG
jgi:hypothetical protein